MSSAQKEQLESYDVVPGPDEMIILMQRKSEILKLVSDMKVKVSNENEVLCLEAVQTLFSNIDNLDLLNKRAVLVYIREIYLYRKTNENKFC